MSIDRRVNRGVSKRELDRYNRWCEFIAREQEMARESQRDDVAEYAWESERRHCRSPFRIVGMVA